MLDILKQQFSQDMPTQEKLNRAREFLQILLLKIMFDKGAFANLAFVGGTALRILHGLRRFSEDLDFSLVNKKGYKFTAFISEVTTELKRYGLEVEAKVKSEKNVHNCLLKFSGLLKELGLSNLAGQKLTIKVEIDTNPPKGWKTEDTIINNVYVFSIKHFDLPSMYATKLHACFYRGFTKGRDFYDFVWYLGKKVKPNLKLLNNAIQQTQKKTPLVTENNFKKFLLNNIKRVDFAYARRDVERFLEDANELKLLERKIIEKNIANF